MASMIRRAAAPAAAAARRSFATEASANLVDFDYLRGKALSETARADVNAKATEFGKRVAAVHNTPAAPEIDWAQYEAALPDYDIAKLKADFEAYVENIPAISYDEATDKAAHSEQEGKWESFAAFAGERLEELAKLKAEAEDHKLHDYYTLNRTFQRFDGLLEKEWLAWRQLNLHENLRTFRDVPEELTAAQKAEVAEKLAAKAGVTPAMLGFKAE